MYCLSKLEAIQLCTTKLGFASIFKDNKFKLSLNTFIDEISKTSYNLSLDGNIGISHGTLAKYVKILLPDRKTNSKICSYILNLFDLKFCPKCELVYHKDEFHNNVYYNTGKGTYCKMCTKEVWQSWYAYHKDEQLARVAEYKARLIKAVPKWADLDAIALVYKNCPKNKVVDHIIPLRGENVSGLHIETNLQYLSLSENCAKGNKFNIE